MTSCIDAAYAPLVVRIPDLPPVSAGLAEEIAENEVWVATDGGTIIGALFLVAREGYMKLANLAVHPSHGRKGLGRALIELSEARARVHGYSEMRLNTHAAMPENISLYEHLGWQEFARDGNTVSMKKSL